MPASESLAKTVDRPLTSNPLLSSPRLLHLLEVGLLLSLLLVRFLQNHTNLLHGLHVLANTSVGTCHFTQRQITIAMSPRGTLFEARATDLLEEVGVHFHLRRGGKERVGSLRLGVSTSEEVHGDKYLFGVFMCQL